MSEMYYESGEFSTFGVKAEVNDSSGNKAVLNISGVHTMSYLKAEQILAVKDKDELADLLFRKICFEDLEGTLEKEPESYALGAMMEYLKGVEDDDGVVIGTLRRIEKKVDEFKESYAALADLSQVVIHQYHAAGGEECDFADYLNVPFEEDADVLREYFEQNLTADSDIDAIMEHFEDGEFYIGHYDSDETLIVDLKNQTVKKQLSVTDVS